MPPPAPLVCLPACVWACSVGEKCCLSDSHQVVHTLVLHDSVFVCLMTVVPGDLAWFVSSPACGCDSLCFSCLLCLSFSVCTILFGWRTGCRICAVITVWLLLFSNWKCAKRNFLCIVFIPECQVTLAQRCLWTVQIPRCGPPLGHPVTT